MPPMRNPLTTPSQPRVPYSNALLHRHSHRSQPLLAAGKASLLALALAAPGMVMADSRLESVYFQQADSGEVRLNLEFDGTPPEIGGYRLDNPPRLTLDLMETRSGLEQNEFSVGLGGVESITAREAGERTRLVVEMARHLEYRTDVRGDHVIVGIQGDKADTPPDLASSEDAGAAYRKVSDSLLRNILTEGAALESTSSNEPAVTDIDFRRGDNGAGRLIVSLNQANADVRVSEAPNAGITARLVGVRLPTSLDQVYDVTDFGSPIQRITPRTRGDSTTLDIQTSGDFAMVSRLDGKQLVIEAQEVSPEDTSQESESAYSGERLTLNFQDIDVRAVLSLIAETAGLNLVARDSVQGRVTLNLNRVPWDQALELILKSHGLDSRQQGNVMVVAPAGELAQQERQELETRELLETLAPLESKRVKIKYAEADTLAQLMRGDGTGGYGMLTDRGQVAVDARTNTLLLRDTPERLKAIMETIADLDVPVEQVQIEGRIVIASQMATRELGVNWGVSGSGSRFDLGGASDGTPINGNGGLAVDLGAGSRGAGGSTTFSFGYLSGDILLDLELNAMESEGKSYTISQPRIITANQTEAYIKQGQERAYREAAASGASAVEFKEAVLSMTVKPRITPNGRILMDVTITNDSFGETDGPNQEPPINMSELKSKVLVKDGQTVVLGGILQSEDIETLAKTPFLGDIPVLGKLFQYSQTNNDKLELLVFITPKILSEDLGI